MAKLIDLTSQRFGRLTVVERASNAFRGNGLPLVRWKCLCDCGQRCTILANSLRMQRTLSCGCFLKEIAKVRGSTINLRHGQNRRGNISPEYHSWRGMIQRCENPKTRSYGDYGGRGISVCPEWRESFERFFADLGPRPSSSHTLDRIEGDNNYEPSNCRWATKTEQSRNVRRSRLNSTGVKGVQRSAKNKYRATIGFEGKSLFLGDYDSVKEAAKARKSAEKKYWGVGK